MKNNEYKCLDCGGRIVGVAKHLDGMSCPMCNGRIVPLGTIILQSFEEESIQPSMAQNKDNINPSHYRNGKVECIDALESATVGKKGIEAVCTANIIKYLWRYEDKNGIEDIKKAQWYLNRLLKVKGKE